MAPWRWARWWRWPAALAGLVVLAGLSGSVALTVALTAGQQRAAQVQLDRRVAQVRDAVVLQAGRYVDTLHTVAAALGAIEPLTAARFAQVTAPLAGMDLPGATSIAFLVPSTDEQLGAVQARWRSRGVPTLTFAPKGSGYEHVFSVFSRPLDGSTAPAVGIDAAQIAAPATALTAARRTGGVTVSDAYQLLRDQQLPPASRQMSFVLTAPVYGPEEADGLREFRGWTLMGLRGQDFVGATLSRAAQDLLDVTLLAASGADATMVAVAGLRSTVSGTRDLGRVVDVPVANRVWQLRVAATGTRLPGAGTTVPLISGASGLMFSLIVGGLVYVLATGRARARLRVRAATGELAAAEAEARRHAGLLTAIVDSISDGVGVVDEHGAFLLHNPAAQAMLGVGEDRDGTEHWQAHYGIFHIDGATPFPNGELPLVRALDGHVSEQVPMVIRNAGNPDGVVISVSARPLDRAGGQAGAVAVFHDITARTRADRDLAAAAARLRDELAARQAAEEQLQAAHDEVAAQQAFLAQVLDAVEVTVITCDVTGAIVHANRAARVRTPSAGRAVALTDTLADIGMTHPDGRPFGPTEAPLLRSLAGEHVDNVEARISAADGHRRSIMIHSRPLYDPLGLISGAVGTSYDITALREREAELARFAGVVAHDLKNPLTAIAGFGALLQDELAGAGVPDRPLLLLDRLIIATARMRRLIDDLLSYAASRDRAIAPVAFELRAVVDDVVTERLAATTGTPPAQIFVGPLPWVLADPPMVRQLIDNLVSNALKYTPPGQPARIDITAALSDADRDRVRVEVADRGIGVPDGQHEAIFSDFHRAHSDTSYAGTGLGLAICHRVVARHGGTIGVVDNPGGGARFWFTLPAVDARRDTVAARRATRD